MKRREQTSEWHWTWPWPTCVCHVNDDHAPERVHAWHCNLAAKPRDLTDEQVREMMA
jgi:hypothetical protein